MSILFYFLIRYVYINSYFRYKLKKRFLDLNNDLILYQRFLNHIDFMLFHFIPNL